MIKRLLKKILPVSWLSVYHKALALFGAFVYGHPSRDLLVIGVTGTKGKSTTSNMLWKLLTDAGHTVGLTGTINYRIGEKEWLSTNKMTMVGRFQMQKLLRDMVRAGCDIAIIETTSEGIKQSRHIGIDYDIAVFTNLSPEHLESHGGFENYKNTKKQLFERLEQLPSKQWNGDIAPRAAVVNMDSEHADEFLSVGTFTKVRVGSADENEMQLTKIIETAVGTDFAFNGAAVHIPLLGSWNAQNAAIAMAVATVVGVPEEQLVQYAAGLLPVPGRMEFVDAGQEYTVVVDYAYEPLSLELLYRFCRSVIGEHNKLITLISSTGGGRDVGRRIPNGRVAGELCDYVIVTDEDPYDDDPQAIIDQVAEGVRGTGKQEGKQFWRVLDRRDAIEKACSLAGKGDIVILTAKGAEQKMCVANGKKIDWDDREVARVAIQNS